MTTGKPDDIPDAVWNTAGQVVNQQGYAADAAHIEPIARAILAAKAEEREACALAADANGGWTRGGSLYSAGVNEASKKIAAAIRKRGEG